MNLSLSNRYIYLNQNQLMNKNVTSFTSSPLQDKQNLCPNHKFNTVFVRSKKHPKEQASSMRTDSEFNMFKTINVPRPSQHFSMTTKSRADMEAILQNFSTRSESHRKISQYSHKSFLALLGLAFGKEQFSVDEAIQKCEQFQISGKNQLLSIMDQKEPTRQWPLPLSNLLLTDLGQLKVMKICQNIESQEELNDYELQILQFLLPNVDNIEVLDRSLILEGYNQFRNKIDEKFNQVDELVQKYTLRVQPKIRKIGDKVGLIKMEKKMRRCAQDGGGSITFAELKSCMGVFALTEDQLLLVFKYLFFQENDKVVDLVDRQMRVSLSICYQQLLQKEEHSLAKHDHSTWQLYEEQNNTVIKELLNDKSYLLETVDSKNNEIEKLNNEIVLLKFELQNRERHYLMQKQRQVQNVRNKYQKMVGAIEQESRKKDQMIRWYKGQIEAIVEQNKRQFIATNRNKVFYKVVQSTARNDCNDDDEEEESCEQSHVKDNVIF